MDLYRLNLNLLVALDVLLTEQSVTKAAKKLFMTQAAMSNNLQQLREVFKDELLMREKNRMVPTSYATSLQPRLHEILEELRSVVLVGQSFLPQVSRRTFKIMMTDYMSALILPKLIQTLEAKAPEIKIVALPVDYHMQDPASSLSDCDLAVCKGQYADAHLKKKLLFKDRAVSIINAKHPLAKKASISLDEYLAYPHIAICLNNPEIPTLVEEALSKLNRTRRIQIGIPFVGVIFQMIQASHELIGTVPEQVAKLYQAQYSFAIKPLPIPMDEMDFNLIWHPRHDNDAGHCWLREELMRCVSE
jgi:DNA-binding transcriptional LysR family regulator